MKALTRGQKTVLRVAMVVYSLIFFVSILCTPQPVRESNFMAWTVYILFMALGAIELLQKRGG